MVCGTSVTGSVLAMSNGIYLFFSQFALNIDIANPHRLKPFQEFQGNLFKDLLK
jgi:hypothetical protein